LGEYLLELGAGSIERHVKLRADALSFLVVELHDDGSERWRGSSQ